MDPHTNQRLSISVIKMAHPGILLIFLICVSKFQVSSAIEVYFDRIELMNSSYIEGLYNVSEYRIAKFNRTTYVFNANMEIFYDTDRNHTVGVEFFYNRFNNNQYSKTPFRVTRAPICDFVEKYYNLLSSDEIANITNFIKHISGKNFCPLKKVHLDLLIEH